MPLDGNCSEWPNPPAPSLRIIDHPGRSVLDMKGESSVIIPQLPDQVELLDTRVPACAAAYCQQREQKSTSGSWKPNQPWLARIVLSSDPTRSPLTGPSSRLSEIDHWSTELVVLPADSGWVLGKSSLVAARELEASCHCGQ